MKILTKILTRILFFCLVFIGSGEAKLLCPRIELQGELNPDLDRVEKDLVCGEPRGKPSSTGGAWAEIPFWQAEYNFKNFLQKRGYLHPQFSVTPDQKKMTVVVGPKAFVTRIVIEGEDAGIDISRMRQIVGQPLAPSSLDTLEKWIGEKLKNRGYACPKVSSHADAETGTVKVTIDPGSLQSFFSITEESIPGLEEGVLQRYDAFELGEPYQENLLTVTSQRVINSGIVESSHFRSYCLPDGVHLKQEVLPGRPRLLIVGAGANSEGVLLGKFIWKNTRLGRFGSLLDVSASGSAKLQTLQAAVNWYFLPKVSRFHLAPIVQLKHDNEQHFEVLSLINQIGIASTLDHGSVGASWFLGPTLNFYRTLSGVGAGDAYFLFLEGRFNLKSHDYELYTAEPNRGYNLSWYGDFSQESLFSSASVQRLGVSGETLWNLGLLEPPLWIVGVRGGFATVLTAEPRSVSTVLPASFFQYLGGSANLRGFGRQELPADAQGGVSSAYLGLELRLSHTLPLGLDPFLLVDVGAIGSGSFSLDTPLYWSPGFGLRWASPVGPFRTTLAHGYTGQVPNHWQFYFSLGEEF